ncbi:MAG TPA: alpha-amylase family glycosyl hydrolase [Puia sp.]|jgi:maltose alpha-D-glucosyltransferase/alpha-amylase|nr:alpha-amylase family glycosyl hydrolase [Puia sp.]
MKTIALLAFAWLFCPGLYAQHGPTWIKQAVFYQIYPSSFQDGDGNGIGDLKGIQSRLDYIQSIGVNVIYLNPIFTSAFKDGGYDVIDF